MSRVIVPAIAVATIVAIAAFLMLGDGWRLILCHGKPITASDADLNKDGHVTFTEASYACDGATRAIEHDGDADSHSAVRRFSFFVIGKWRAK